MEKMARNTGSLKPVEVVFFTYLLTTLLVILLFHSRLEFWTGQVAMRMVALILTTGFLFARQGRITAFLRTFTPFVFLSFFYSETALFHQLLFPDLLDHFFVDLDQAVFGFQPAIAFSRAFNYSFFSEMMFFGYFSYYVLIIAMPVYIYVRAGKSAGERFAFIIINSLLIYYLLFSVFPVAGPQYYFPPGEIQVPAGYLFEPLIRIIQGLAERPTGAFPSSHVSICLMLVWGGIKYAGKWIYLVVPTAVLLILSTIYIGAHYAVDVIGGILVTPLMYWISDMLYNTLSRCQLKILK